jgi:hypothetical protein
MNYIQEVDKFLEENNINRGVLWFAWSFIVFHHQMKHNPWKIPIAHIDENFWNCGYLEWVDKPKKKEEKKLAQKVKYREKR